MLKSQNNDIFQYKYVENSYIQLLGLMVYYLSSVSRDDSISKFPLVEEIIIAAEKAWQAHFLNWTNHSLIRTQLNKKTQSCQASECYIDLENISIQNIPEENLQLVQLEELIRS